MQLLLLDSEAGWQMHWTVFTKLHSQHTAWMLWSCKYREGNRKRNLNMPLTCPKIHACDQPCTHVQPTYTFCMREDAVSKSLLKLMLMVTDVRGPRLADHSQSLLSPCRCVSVHCPLSPVLRFRAVIGGHQWSCLPAVSHRIIAVVHRQANGMCCH